MYAHGGVLTYTHTNKYNKTGMSLHTIYSIQKGNEDIYISFGIIILDLLVFHKKNNFGKSSDKHQSK